MLNPMSKLGPRTQAWMEQLRRMREMQYAYHRKFFHGLYFFLLLVIGCLLWGSPFSLAVAPFLVITAGTQSCFYLHFADFARMHARHLEKKLNQNLGRATLVGAQIEDLYFYPLDTSKIGGFIPSRPLRFFSFFTIHWILLWSALTAYALWRLLPWMGSQARDYLILWLIWGGIHITYLGWYFGRSRDLKAVQARLDLFSRPTR